MPPYGREPYKLQSASYIRTKRSKQELLPATNLHCTWVRYQERTNPASGLASKCSVVNGRSFRVERGSRGMRQLFASSLRTRATKSDANDRPALPGPKSNLARSNPALRHRRAPACAATQQLSRSRDFPIDLCAGSCARWRAASPLRRVPDTRSIRACRPRTRRSSHSRSRSRGLRCRHHNLGPHLRRGSHLRM